MVVFFFWFFFFKVFFKKYGCGWTMFKIFIEGYNITSVLCFGFLATRNVGS